MATCHIGYRNRVLSSTLTAGSEQAGLTVGNLQNQHGSSAFAWRTAGGVTTSWFMVDQNLSNATWRAFCLARTNLTASAQVRVRVGQDSGFASPAWDSGTVSGLVVAGFNQAVLASPSEVVGRYCRVDIADASNPDGHLSVALAFAGPTWEPSINISPESTLSLARERQLVRTRGGSTYVTPLWTERAWNIAFGAVLTSELWAQVLPAELAAADGRNVLFLPDPASANRSREAVFGMLETTSDVGFATPDGQRRTWRARVVERL